MSPAPETLRRSPNPSTSTSSTIYPSTNSPTSISISTILSRAPRTVSSTDATVGAFSADRRATTSIRRNFSYSGGPRPPPFRRVTPTNISAPSTSTVPEDGESGMTRQLLISALEIRRRRIEELRAQTNVTNSIVDQWRRQRSEESTRNEEYNSRRSMTPETVPSIPTSVERPETPVNQIRMPPALLFNDDSSDSESDDEDPDNKFPSSMNDIRQTPPPTFATPHSSPSQTDSSQHHDDDSSRNAYTLTCRFCANLLTKRGMRARLVADARVHIWSTDEEPKYHPPRSNSNKKC
jgi:hypothetical protein